MTVIDSFTRSFGRVLVLSDLHDVIPDCDSDTKPSSSGKVAKQRHKSTVSSICCACSVGAHASPTPLRRRHRKPRTLHSTPCSFSEAADDIQERESDGLGLERPGNAFDRPAQVRFVLPCLLAHSIHSCMHIMQIFAEKLNEVRRIRI